MSLGVMKNVKRITLATLLAATMAVTAACGTSNSLKDMSSEGYQWGFFQHARGTVHNRELVFLVDRLNFWPDASYNVLEGSYFNTGTEAPEHLRDAAGRMIFSQNEGRRYFAWTNNDRNDISRIMLFEPSTQTLNTAFMSRYKTEWWGDADLRAISVNNGPVIIRTEGIGEHLIYKDQRVFSVVVPKSGMDFSWMFNQDKAVQSRAYLENLLKDLEKTDFNPPDQNVLMSTHDNDRFFDWAGVETSAAQGELFNGAVKYVIAANYFGENNKPFAGRGFLRGTLFGHQGAPDKSNKAGSALDTVTIALGETGKPESWKPKAKIVVYHPTWSNQTEYVFIEIGSDGSEKRMGIIQRTYNNKSVSDSDGRVVEVAATNNYLAKGDTDFMASVMVLLGGQQVPLGFDYKTSFLDYGLDLIRMGQGTSGATSLPSEAVASLNVNANATIENVISAAEKVLGAQPRAEFKNLLAQQKAANDAFHKEARQLRELKEVYGLK